MYHFYNAYINKKHRYKLGTIDMQLIYAHQHFFCREVSSGYSIIHSFGLKYYYILFYYILCSARV